MGKDRWPSISLDLTYKDPPLDGWSPFNINPMGKSSNMWLKDNDYESTFDLRRKKIILSVFLGTKCEENNSLS